MNTVVNIKNINDLMLYLNKCDYEIEFENDGMYFYLNDHTLKVEKEFIKLIDMILYVFDCELMSFADEQQFASLIDYGYNVVI